MGTWSGAEETEEALPSSTCPICGGAGFVHPLLPSGKPDFSRVIPCRCTREALDKEREAHLLRYSNLGSLTRFTFDSLIGTRTISGRLLLWKIRQPAIRADDRNISMFLDIILPIYHLYSRHIQPVTKIC